MSEKTETIPKEEEVKTNDEDRFEKLKAALASENPEDVAKLFASDPDLATEVESKTDQELNELINESAQVEKQEESVEDSESQDEEEIAEEKPKEEPEKPVGEVDVKINPERLGTYAKNRDPQAAVEEAIKGLGEKDRYIEHLKGLVDQLESKLENPEKEPDNHSKQEEKKEKEEIRKRKIVLEHPDDDGYLDDDHQKKITDANIEAQERIEKLEAKLASMEADANAQMQMQAQEARQAAEEQSIKNLMVNNREIFNTERDAFSIEKDYQSFLRDLKRVAGIDGDMFAKDKNGNIISYSREIMEAQELYHDESRGAELREKCEKAGVKAPADLGALELIYEVRKIANSNQTLDPGSKKYRNLTLAEAFDRYQKDNINVNDITRKARKAGHEDRKRAIENDKKYARETSTEDGSMPVKLENVDVADWQALVSKKDKTEQDKVRIRNIAKQVPGITEKDIQEFCT